MKRQTSNKWNWMIVVLMIIGACFTSAPSGQGEISAQYDMGECTWWAATRASETGWEQFPQALGNAGMWDDNASHYGIYQGNIPRGGAIAIWEATNDPSGALGHVGFVERVNEDGTILITEYNYPLGSGKRWTTFPRPGRNNPDSYIYPPYTIAYEHANYAGKWSPIKSDQNDLTLQKFQYGDGENWHTDVYIGDQISSLWVPPNWSVELFEHAGYGGSRLGPFSDPVPNLANNSFNDKTSSIKAYQFACPAGGVVNFGLSESSGEQVGQIVDGPPVKVEQGTTMGTSEISAQEYSGICGTGSSSPATPPGAPSQQDHTQWRLSFYNNEGTSGSPVWFGTDGTGGISHNWGIGSPVSGVNADYWSARWEREVYFRESGDWKFTVRSDDGFRLFIDGQLFAHEWSEGWHDISPSKYLTAGTHHLRLDYFDHTGSAQINLSWGGPPVPDGTFHDNWYAEWFNWDDLDPAKRVSTSWESAINYDWGTGSPGHGLGTDNFSARWTGTFWFPDDWFYKFPVRSDDGFRLKVDGQVIGQEWSEGWHDVAPDTRLSAGNHGVVLEYFEKWDQAKVKLSWFRLPDDTTAPTGSIVSPIDGETINANQLRICAQVDDGEGLGVNKVQILLYHLAQSSSWQTVGTDTDSRDGWCVTWDHSSWPDEEINTHIFAWDRADNLFSGGGVTFRIDRTVPTGNFIAPTSNSTVSGSTLNVRVNANDNLSNGVDRVAFEGHYDAGSNNIGWWPMMVDSDGSDGWGFTWDLSDLPTQAITIRATIYDKAGNSRVIEATNVSINPRPASEYVEVKTVSTQQNGVYKDVFDPGESFSLWIGATNHTTWSVDSLWTWEIRNPDGTVNGTLSWSNWPVSMSPAANAWALNRTVPDTPGTYTFKGIVTWGNGAYRSEKTTTFRVRGSETIYLPIVVGGKD